MKSLSGIIAVVFLLITGCVTQEAYDYSAFRAADPKSILVVPVVNNTMNVDAPDYFLSTVSEPVAERGFYVYPVNLVKKLMELDGLSDANLVHDADATRLASLFGADAVLYITINRWDAQYVVVSTTVTVEFSYVLKDGDTGVELWRSAERMQYTPDSNNQSLLVMVVQAAITKAAPNYMPLARQANQNAVLRVGRGLPAGPYNVNQYQNDLNSF